MRLIGEFGAGAPVGLSLPPALRAVVNRNRAALLGAGVGALLALKLTAEVWGARLPAGGDVTGHLIRTDTGLALLGNGQLDGWSPRFGVGYQQSLFYGPGFTWLVAAIKVLTFGSLSTAGALKVVIIGSVAAIAPAAAFAARSLGLSSRGAGIAAVVSLLASSPFGVGLDGLFGSGLIPQQFAGVLFLVALGSAYRVLAGAGPWTVVLALTIAGLIVTHIITLVILGVTLACLIAVLAVTRRLEMSGLLRLAASGSAAAGIAAFWIVPFLVHRNLHGPVATWGTPDFGTRIGDILSGRVLFKPLAAKAVIVGFVVGLVRIGERRLHALILVVLPVATLAIGHWSIHALPNEMTIQLANRSLGLAGILATFPLAALVCAVSERIPLSALIKTVLALVAVSYLVLRTWTGVEATARQAGAVAPHLRAAAAELERVVPPAGRFVTVRDYPGEIDRTGTLQPDRWLAWASNRNLLNAFPLELSSTPEAYWLVDRLAEGSTDETWRLLVRYGVTHVVTTSAEQVTSLLRSPGLGPVWSQGTMTILEVEPVGGQPPPAAQLTATVNGVTAEGSAEASNGRLRVEVFSQAPTVATMALAWSPKWRAQVNGEEVPVERTTDGLLSIVLPQGPAAIDLRFRPDIWDRAGLAASLVAIGGRGWWLASRRRRSRSVAAAPPG